MSDGTKRLFRHPSPPGPFDLPLQRLLDLEALACLEDRLEQVEVALPCVCGNRTNDKAVHRVKEPCFLPVDLKLRTPPPCDHSGTTPHLCDGGGLWRCAACGTHVKGPASCQEAAWGWDIKVGQFYRSRTFPEVLWLVTDIEKDGMFPIKMRRSDTVNQTHVGGFDAAYMRQEMEPMTVVPVSELGALRDRGANAVLVPADQLAKLQQEAAAKDKLLAELKDRCERAKENFDLICKAIEKAAAT